MFDFDDYENLNEYIFTYPAFELLKNRCVGWLKKHKLRVTPWEYRNKIIEYVKEEIQIGYRKYGEVEPEWENLKYHIKEVENDFNNGNSLALDKAVILYDQVLLLLYEGNPLPPNLI